MTQTFIVTYLVIFIIILVIGFLCKGERFQMYQATTGRVVNVKRGFSFTYFFFGPLVPLFRGHIGGFFFTLFIELFTCGVAHIILLFCYNGMYINWLSKNGYCRVEESNDAPASRLDSASTPAPASASSAPPSTPAPALASSTPAPDFASTPASAPRPDLTPASKLDPAPDVDNSEGALVGIEGAYGGAQIPLQAGDQITIGRDSEQCNLVIDDKNISRRHCEITYDPYSRMYQICDHSTNGVYVVDGPRLETNRPVTLKPGTVIQIGTGNHIFLLK